jgi:hypothetical protein
MVFITQSWKSAPFDRRGGWGWPRATAFFAICMLALTFLLPRAEAAAAASAGAAQLSQLRVERADDGVYLTAALAFELPPVVEDALLKGIALFFVVEANIYRDRWYWTDQRVGGAARTVRLAYQPLTRRWRVNIGPGVIGTATGLRATFNQNYDTLPEALSAVQRVARWKVAEPGDIRPGTEHSLEFSFRLDLSQLPRPFQIGVAGQRDWTIALDSVQRLNLAPARTADADSAESPP